MSKDVFVLRGAPASGKGSVAPMLCESLQKPVALIEQDKFRWGIHTFGREVTDITDEEHMLAYRVTVAAYEEYLRKGIHTIVVEGLFTYDNSESSQGNVLELKELAARYGYNFTSMVLKAAINELRRRNDAREHVVPPDEFKVLYAGAYEKIGDDEVIIDSTNKNVHETVEEILKYTHTN